jgi:hypothetical protein
VYDKASQSGLRFLYTLGRKDRATAGASIRLAAGTKSKRPMVVEPSAPKGFPSWQAMSLRVSLFPPSPIDATEKMWTAMMGAPPETQERRTRAITTKFTGPMEGATVVLASSPLRIDVIIQPSPPPPKTIPTIVAGDAAKLTDLLAERVPALLNCLPSLTRLAFAGILLHQVNSPEDVLKLLKGMLKSVTVGRQSLIARRRLGAADLNSKETAHSSAKRPKVSVSSRLCAVVGVMCARDLIQHPRPLRSA